MTCISNTTSTVLYVNNTDAIRYGTYVHVQRGVSAQRDEAPRRLFTRTYAAQFSSKSTRTSKTSARASGTPARAPRARRRRTWNRYVLEEGGRASPPRGRAGRLRRGREGRATPGEALGEIFLLHARRFPRRRGGVRGDRAGDVPDALFPPHPRARAGGLRADAARRAAGRARWRTSSRTWCPAWTPGRWTTSCAPFWSRAARAATLGYRGYNHSTCISPNEVVCHGARARASCCARATSSTWTSPWSRARDGTATPRVRSSSAAARPPPPRVGWWTTRDALRLGLEACRPGARIGDVLEPIARRLRAEGYGVVDRYAAHGVGRRFHQPPTIRHGAGARRGAGCGCGRGTSSRSSRWRPKTGRSKPRRSATGGRSSPRTASRGARSSSTPSGWASARARSSRATTLGDDEDARSRECISIDASIDASVIPLVRKQNQSLRNNTRVRAFVRGARLLSPPGATPSRKTPSSVSRKQNAGSMETSSRECGFVTHAPGFTKKKYRKKETQKPDFTVRDSSLQKHHK